MYCPAIAKRQATISSIVPAKWPTRCTFAPVNDARAMLAVALRCCSLYCSSWSPYSVVCYLIYGWMRFICREIRSWLILTARLPSHFGTTNIWSLQLSLLSCVLGWSYLTLCLLPSRTKWQNGSVRARGWITSTTTTSSSSASTLSTISHGLSTLHLQRTIWRVRRPIIQRCLATSGKVVARQDAVTKSQFNWSLLWW